MTQLNSNFFKLSEEYLFEKIKEKASSYKNVCNLGIGDISLPMPQSLIEYLQKELPHLSKETLGYPPSFGYPFLKEAILENDYSFSNLSSDEVFISNGAKFDLAHFHELFSPNSTIGITAPGYPVYFDACSLSGYKNIYLLECVEENDFLPVPPEKKLDLIYLCSPNNPTGTTFTRPALNAWVEYALKHQAILIFDAAYASFIRSSNPKSIYEIEGAEKVAVEVKSFSKGAGFTNFRCSYSVIPKDLPIYPLWKRQSSTKLGGVSWIAQKAAFASFFPKIKQDLEVNKKVYQKNVDQLKSGLEPLNLSVFGGLDSPFLWVKVPDGVKSWDFFDLLLKELQIVCVPGTGLGEKGEGYVRFSGFAHPSQVDMALQRLSKFEAKFNVSSY